MAVQRCTNAAVGPPCRHKLFARPTRHPSESVVSQLPSLPITDVPFHLIRPETERREGSSSTWREEGRRVRVLTVVGIVGEQR